MLVLDIDIIARGAYEAIRQYNASIGDADLPAWSDLDARLQAATVTDVQTALAGAAPRQQHDDLPEHQRIKDEVFLAAVRSAAVVYSLLRA